MISIVKDSRFYDALLQIDKELAADARDKGCPSCGGSLHSACYPRKMQDSYLLTSKNRIMRFSFCCRVDGCRHRVTPRSVRFLGRKRYLSVAVVIVSAMSHGLTQKRADELAKLIGVSLRTISRWQTWWQETVSNTGFWQHRKSLIMTPLNPAKLCRDLVEYFTAQCAETGMMNLLRFLSPLSCKLYGGLR
jgi:hypothetical protein